MKGSPYGGQPGVREQEAMVWHGGESSRVPASPPPHPSYLLLEGQHKVPCSGLCCFFSVSYSTATSAGPSVLFFNERCLSREPVPIGATPALMGPLGRTPAPVTEPPGRMSPGKPSPTSQTPLAESVPVPTWDPGLKASGFVFSFLLGTWRDFGSRCDHLSRKMCWR